LSSELQATEEEIMLWVEILILISDVVIAYYVYMEYQESRETNKALTKLMNKQRKGKQKISVDRVIKAAIQSGEGQ
jgi:transcriptional regulator of NAD metabolism